MTKEVILITGGSGSLGMALIPQLLILDPGAIRVLSNNEYELYLMMEKFKDKRIRPLVGDIRDKDRLMRAMIGVDYVIHAAALKNVSLCEYNPIDAIKTNILGSVNIVDSALDSNVKKVIAISSDKAVHPISLYGATKLVMESLFIQSNVYGKTKFSCARFGNFIGSRGSFLETIEKKMMDGEPITITDKDMERYWISLEDAAAFVIKSLDRMNGGEVFVPKMNKRKIMDFIKVEYPIVIIGRRDGERMEEELFSDAETPKDCGEYYVIKK